MKGFVQAVEHLDAEEDEECSAGQADGDLHVWFFDESTQAEDEDYYQGDFYYGVAEGKEDAGVPAARAGLDGGGGHWAWSHYAG